jgi:predicted acyl esterase
MSANIFDRSTYTVSKAPTKRPAIDVDPPSSVLLPAGHAKFPKSRSFSSDVRYEHNQSFPMRDGCSLSVDVFRPVSGEPVPAIIMWSPYGKSGTGPWNLGTAALRSGVAEERLSGYESFEGYSPTLNPRCEPRR